MPPGSERDIDSVAAEYRALAADPAKLTEGFVEAIQTSTQRFPGMHMLDFVPLDAFPGLIDLSLDELEKHPRNPRAEEVLGTAFLQAEPEVVKRLDRIVGLCVKECLYPGILVDAWEDLGWDATAPLRRVIESDHPPHQLSPTYPPRDISLRTWFLRALLESKDQRVLEYAMEESSHAGREPLKNAAWELFSNGAILHQGTLYQLYWQAPFHLWFPNGPRQSPAMPVHPTWARAREDAPRVPFGGRAQGVCESCGGPLTHLLTFRPEDAGLPLTPQSVTFITCLNCVSHEPSFFQHDADGMPSLIQWGPDEYHVMASGNPQPLVAQEARLHSLGPRWRKPRLNVNENVNRIGGSPLWLQSGTYPRCTGCRAAMRFLAQIDSGFPTENGYWLGLMWGSGGLLYLYWCSRCQISAQLWQCT